jgi:hypothetical protein
MYCSLGMVAVLGDDARTRIVRTNWTLFNEV